MRQGFIGLLSVASMLLWSPVDRVNAKPRSPILNVAPFTTRPGGIVFLSGAGFPGVTRLNVSMACERTKGTAASALTTDARGQFLAKPFRTLATPVRSLTPCRIYAADRTGRAVAMYYLTPPTIPLGRCAIHMCIRVRALLTRLPDRAQGTIEITGWPGAAAEVTVTYPDGHVVRRALQLPWQGAGVIRMTIAHGLLKGVKTTVSATTRLGGVQGHATTHFVVMPGGR
jgi:hypothetical protein